MDSVVAIHTFLDAVKRRYLRRSFVRALLWVLAGLSLLAVAGPLLAASWPTRSLSISILLAALAAVIVPMIVAWRLPARRLADPRHTARLVGERAPSVASDLMSCVELATDRRQHDSPELVEALLSSTEARVGELAPSSLVPFRRLRQPAGWAVLFSLCAGLVIVIMPDRIGTGWRGLWTQPTPSPFASAVDHPLVGDIELELTFPGYTGRDTVVLPASSGDVEVMPGTTLRFRTMPLAPTRHADLLVSNTADGEAMAVELRVDDGEIRGQIVARTPVFYRFALEGDDGEQRVERRAHTVEIEDDAAPQVELHAPADELDVARLRRIEIAYVAEDDYGISRAELVVTDGEKQQRIPLPVPPTEGQRQPRMAQYKHLWDLADFQLTPGVRIGYHVEVFDNDDVTGPNVGHSKTYYLRVYSRRERRESLVQNQRQLAETLLDLLADRLVVPPQDLRAHDGLQRRTDELAVALGTLLATLGEEDLASPKLVDMFRNMRDRLDQFAEREKKLIERLAKRPVSNQFAESDREQVAELEDDALLVADWLDRQQLENLLAISDEIGSHRERLGALMSEFQRTGSEETLTEIERELRNLEDRLKELQAKRLQLPSDVLDQFVNREAMTEPESTDCIGEVRRLFAEGDVAAATAKMEECAKAIEESAQALEESLRSLRGERFSEEEKLFEEVMSELSDLSADQQEIASKAEEIYESYAKKAAEATAERGDQVRRDVAETLSELRDKLDRVPNSGLSPFSREEMQIAKSRLDDVDRALQRGDIADALSMARSAERSLDTVQGELLASLEERWNRRGKDAVSAVEAARPLARKLVSDLKKATPSPEEMMGRADRARLSKLQRRQAGVEKRTRRLAEKNEGLEGQLPGTSGKSVGEGLAKAAQAMEAAQKRMRSTDPSGAQQKTREAGDSLSKAVEQARDAARRRMQSGPRGLSDEPVRIPGAEEYVPPAALREEILEAMKKDKPPSSFREQVKRYYEDIIR